MEPKIHPISGHDLRDVLSGFILGRIMVVLWAIWLHRNDKYFRGGQPPQMEQPMLWMVL